MPKSDGNGTHFDLTMSMKPKEEQATTRVNYNLLSEIRKHVESHPFEHSDMEPRVLSEMKWYNYCTILLEMVENLDLKLECTEWHLANEAVLHCNTSTTLDRISMIVEEESMCTEWCGKSPTKDDDGKCGWCKLQAELWNGDIV